jgi:dGTPase
MSDDSIRHRINADQESILADWAQYPSNTRGREHEEEQDDMRSCYQLDRDRVLYDRTFRRLKFKTQVFIEPVNDDTRTRLTHTLEVMQIARTVARSLRLNEDLVEATALAHDIGHTPFAHVGESALGELHPNGFHHSRQSLRVVDRLARQGEGLNLTKEVRDGIVKHSKSQGSMFESVAGEEPITAEGTIVRYCDSIAYLNHDIDDAVTGGYLSRDDLPTEAINVLGDHGGERIDRTVRDMIEVSQAKNEIDMSDEFKEATDELRTFMFDNLYLVLGESDIDVEARRVFTELYHHLEENKEIIYRDMPFLENVKSSDIVADYLSLQSDLSTIQLYNEQIGQPLEHLPNY